MCRFYEALICGIYKSPTHRNQLAWWLPWAGAGGNREVGKRVQTFT